jgi:hypothetical protein
MNRDWATVVKALRAKADDSAVSDSEAAALRERANAIETKYGPFTKTYTSDDHPWLPKGATVVVDTKAANSYVDWLYSIIDDSYLYDE